MWARESQKSNLLPSSQPTRPRIQGKSGTIRKQGMEGASRKCRSDAVKRVRCNCHAAAVRRGFRPAEITCRSPARERMACPDHD